MIKNLSPAYRCGAIDIFPSVVFTNRLSSLRDSMQGTQPLSLAFSAADNNLIVCHFAVEQLQHKLLSASLPLPSCNMAAAALKVWRENWIKLLLLCCSVDVATQDQNSGKSFKYSPSFFIETCLLILCHSLLFSSFLFFFRSPPFIDFGTFIGLLSLWLLRRPFYVSRET